MSDMTLNGLDELEAAWVIIANAYGGNWASAPDDWRAAAERWRDEVWHPALDASRVSPDPDSFAAGRAAATPDPPLRFDNATTVREIAYRCAGAGSGAVMRLASDVVMPAAEIGEAVEEILCDFWPEAAADQEKPETDT